MMKGFLTVMGCRNCGKCRSMCEALDCNDGTVRIDYDRCTGCMRCVVMCPNKAIRLLE